MCCKCIRLRYISLAVAHPQYQKRRTLTYAIYCAALPASRPAVESSPAVCQGWDHAEHLQLSMISTSHIFLSGCAFWPLLQSDFATMAKWQVLQVAMFQMR